MENERLGTKMVYPEIRVIELHSRTVQVLDDNTNQWKVQSADQSVSEKFNAWADANDMNPFGTPTIKQTQIQETPTRVVIAYSLCASVISRQNQAVLELALRQQVEQMNNACVGPRPQPVSAIPPVRDVSSASEKQSIPVITSQDSTPPVPVKSEQRFEIPM